MTASTPEKAELAELMRATQAGDSQAYASLLHAISPVIRQIVQRQRGFAGAEDCEDVVQEVLLSVHQVRASYDPDRPFMAWLRAIVRYRLADGARRYSRTRQREITIEEDDVTFSAAAPNTDIGEPNDVEALHKAVEQLPPKQRKAIELLKLNELSVKEAAAITGLSESSLKVATHRAIGNLRKTLGEKDHEHE